MKILIIEDEYNLADAIKERLTKENYLVDINEDGEDGLNEALTGIYDLIILDVMLPRKTGFEILKELKENNIDSKVIMLTAKSMLDDRLQGFDLGADDYLTKPFYVEELLARINVQLKGSNPKESKNILKYKDIELNTKTSKLTCAKTNETVELVCKEFQLLEYFINNKEQVLSKEQIYDRVWGVYNEIESNNLEVYLSFIRKKLKAIGSTVNIKSLRGLGYKMEDKND